MWPFNFRCRLVSLRFSRTNLDTELYLTRPAASTSSFTACHRLLRDRKYKLVFALVIVSDQHVQHLALCVNRRDSCDKENRTSKKSGINTLTIYTVSLLALCSVIALHEDGRHLTVQGLQWKQVMVGIISYRTTLAFWPLSAVWCWILCVCVALWCVLLYLYDTLACTSSLR